MHVEWGCGEHEREIEGVCTWRGCGEHEREIEGVRTWRGCGEHERECAHMEGMWGT